MTGSTISVIIITVAFALLAFVIAFILSYTFGASKIATDKRMEEFKKKEGYTEVSLVKNKKKTRRKKETENGFFVNAVLPEGWNMYSFFMTYRNTRFKLTVTRDGCTAERIYGQPVPICVNGEEITV